MKSTSIRWTWLGSVAALTLAACSGGHDQTKPETSQRAAGTAQNDAKVAAKAGPDPTKFIERFDANKDGVLEVSELPGRMQRWLGKADADKDGKLSADELRAHAESMKKEHFVRLDANKDGALTADEVGEGRWKHLGDADADKDGKVTEGELDKAMTSGKFARPGGEGGFGRGGRGPGGRGKMMLRMDTNQDGALSAEEVGAERWKHISVADADKDGKVTKDELSLARKNGTLTPMKPKPDLDDDDDGPED